MAVYFGKIPLSISPLFWLTAGLIGWLNAGSIPGTLIWIFVVFVSVLVHEIGHAVTSLFFKQKPSIALTPFGGVTSYKGNNLNKFQQFIIVLNGPIFGFLLFGLAFFLLKVNFIQNAAGIRILMVLKWVNLFWSIVNLLPILPLDGGQLLRIFMEGIWGIKGFKIALFIGMIVALGLSLFFFSIWQFLIGAIFFLFAFQSFDSWRKSRFLTISDRKEENEEKLKEGEMLLNQGKTEDAEQIFIEVREKTKKGLLFVMASHFLALIEYEKGEKKKAYELLAPVRKQLPENALAFLHELAFAEEDFPLVCDLSSICYQIMPSIDVAMRNAKAFASLNKPKPAGGWLQTVLKSGKFDKEQIINDKSFDKIRESDEFKKFFLT